MHQRSLVPIVRPLALERLEDRTLLATLAATIDGSDDGHGNGCGCHCCVADGLATGYVSEGTPESLVSSLIESAGALSPLSSLPFFSSYPVNSLGYPTAATIYLDFDGHIEGSWDGGGGVFGSSYDDVSTPVFDLDGDTSTFSTEEIDAIQYIWAAVAEDYRPFNINVTTVAPPSFSDGVAVRVSIGGDGNWYPKTNPGVAWRGSFTGAGDNTAFVFPYRCRADDIVKKIAELASHEAGHTFGLKHQSQYQIGSGFYYEYSPGTGDWAPIMGNSYGAALTTWNHGPTVDGEDDIQADMAVIAGSNNGFGYRIDDHSDGLASATRLYGANQFRGVGVIAQSSDTDCFYFDTPAGGVRVSLATAEINPNLEAMVEIRNAAGTVVTSATATGAVSLTLLPTLAAGRYYVVVRSTSFFNTTYGRVGQYSIDVTVPPSGDALEQNDSRATATNLGVLTSYQNSSLTAEHYDDDYFRFMVASSGTVTVGLSFVNTNGNLELYAYRDNELIAQSTSIQDGEFVSFSVVPGANYYVLVSGYMGATNSYSISMNYNPGHDIFESNNFFSTPTIIQDPFNWYARDLNISNFDSDFFKFTALGSGAASVSISFVHALGDLSLAALDANNQLIGSSTGNTDIETINFNVVKGASYYIRVTGHAGASSPEYAIQLISPDRFEDLNDFSFLPTNLGSFDLLTTRNLSLDNGSDVDYYSFTAHNSGAANVTVGPYVPPSVTANVPDLRLIIRNASGTVVASTDNRNHYLFPPGAVPLYVSFNVEWNQTYTIEVSTQVARNFFYDLTVDLPYIAPDRFEDNDFRATATNFGAIPVIDEAHLTLDQSGEQDWYSFTPSTSGLASASLSNLVGSVEFRAYDGVGTPLVGGTSTLANRTILFQVVAGQKYYVYVAGDENTDYRLQIQTPGNQAPIVAAVAAVTITEGQSATFSASGTYDPNGHGLYFFWDINGDGQYGDATGVSPTLTWAQLESLSISGAPSGRPVTVKVTDTLGASTISAPTSLAILNAPPQLVVASITNVVAGEPVSFTFTAVDPSSMDQLGDFQFLVDWNGDGTVDQTVRGRGTTSVSHVFTEIGGYAVRVVAVDQDGGASSAVSRTTIVNLWLLRTDALDNTKTDLIWGGTNGIDAYGFVPGFVLIQAQNNQFFATPQYVFTGNYNGKAYVYGQAGGDLIFADVMNRSLVVFGGDGDDVLIGGRGSDTIDGGNGNDIIFGGTLESDGNDLLLGGAGDDLLVGHLGADSLHGGAGKDLLMAGALSFGSTNLPSAVYAIQAEWTSGRPLQTKVDNILGSGAGPRNNGDYFLQSGSTALNDASVDQVFGDGEEDWLIVDEETDTFVDVSLPDEIVTDL